MDTWTRRRFLIASGVTAGGGLAAGAATVTLPDLLRAARGDADPGAGTLVLVTLYGGNDGLNTVIPAGEPAYQDARPDLAYRQDEVLPLADGLGLNPSMKGLKSLWDAGRLAVVRGVSYPKPDRSHFRSMAIWQTASPRSPTPAGWLGRWLDVTGGDPLHALSLDATLPPMLAGTRTAGAALLLDRAGGRTGGRTAAPLARAQDGEHPLQARVATSIADMLAVEAATDPVLRDGAAAGDEGEDDDRPADGATTGGRSRLSSQLAVVARCVGAGVPTRVYSVSLGGFDTHANEKSAQSRLLGELDAAVSGFLRAVRSTPRGAGTVVAIYSEFGRRVRANANQGTDHGTAGPVLLAGDPVDGGMYGEQPSLTDLDDGDLKVTTDFRDVYAELLERVLGTDAGPVLDGHRGRIGAL
jgi:uncharacterized protein (DUF1501 family)